MRARSAGVILAIILSSHTMAEAAEFTRAQMEAIVGLFKFRSVNSKNEIPKVWWPAMGLQTCSDIGGPFQAGCTKGGPRHRLIGAAISGFYAIELSEHGGSEYSRVLRMFKVSKYDVDLVYEEVIRSDARLKEVQKMLGPRPVATAQGKKKMTKEEAEALLSASKFTKVKSRNDIPKVWWEAMGLENMSDIGGAFSAGCTGPAPHVRLAAGAISEPYALTVSEHGGFAYYHRLNIYKRDNGKIECVYTEMMQPPRVDEIIKKLTP